MNGEFAALVPLPTALFLMWAVHVKKSVVGGLIAGPLLLMMATEVGAYGWAVAGYQNPYALSFATTLAMTALAHYYFKAHT